MSRQGKALKLGQLFRMAMYIYSTEMNARAGLKAAEDD